MGPPPVPPASSFPVLATDWFQDAFWTATVVPELNAAQTAYTTAKNQVTLYQPTYDASKAALEAAIQAALAPGAGQDELDDLDAAKQDFIAKSTEYNTRIANLKTASDTLIAKFRQAQGHVDTEGDANFDDYVSQLLSTVGLELTLAGVDTNTLPGELTDANDARNTARGAFLNALEDFQDAEIALTQSRVELQQLQDDLLIAEADVALATLELDLAQQLLDQLQDILDQAEQDLQDAIDFLNSLPPLHPGIPAAQAAVNAAQIAVDNAQADVDAQQIVVDTAQADVDAAVLTRNGVQAAVTAKQTEVAGLVTARNSARTTLNTELGEYVAAIDDLIAVLEDAYDVHSAIPAQFAQDLADAKLEAQTLVDQALQAAIDADAALLAQHLADFPTAAPPSVLQDVADLRLETIAAIEELKNRFDASQVSQVVANIDIPELPPGGITSMNDLMRFISSIQRFITRLIQAIREADNSIDSLRLKIWDLQNTFDIVRQQTLFEWALTVIAADEAYNVQVATDNHENSQAIFDAVDLYLNDPVARQIIDDTVDELNQDIEDQNQRGVDVTTALNNANFIATDVINYDQNVPIEITNTNDIFMLEADESLPAQRTDPPSVMIPTQIPPYPDYDTNGLPAVADSIPIPDVGVDPLDPLDTEFVPPEEELPTQQEVDDLNEIVEYLNDFLYPIRERLMANGLDFSLIDKLYVREYTEVRLLEDIIDIDSAFEAFQNILNIVNRSQQNRIYGDVTSKGQALDPFTAFLDLSRVPVTEGQHESAQPVGAGAGILGANILASTTKVSAAVQTVFGSQTFLSSVASLIEQGTLIGGLQTLTQLPTLFANYSQLGIVRSDLVGEVGEEADIRLEDALNEVFNVDDGVRLNTAVSLIDLAVNPALLRDRIVGVIGATGPFELSEEELQELIASLLAILQVLLLLLATLLIAAAGVAGGTLPEIVEQLFKTPEEGEARVVIDQIRDLVLDIISGVRTKEPLAVEEAPGETIDLEEPVTAEKPVVTKEEAVVAEPVVAAEPVVGAEPVVATEPVVVTGPVVPTEPVVVTGPVVTGPVVPAEPVVVTGPVVGAKPTVTAEEAPAEEKAPIEIPILAKATFEEIEAFFATLDVTDPTFIAVFADLLTVNLALEERQALLDKIVEIFTQQGIAFVLETERDIGKAIIQAIEEANDAIKEVIRNELIQAEIASAEILRNELLRRAIQVPEVRNRIITDTQTALDGLTPEVREQTLRDLQTAIPNFTLLPATDQAIVQLGVGLGLITTEQARAFSEAIRQEAARARETALREGAAPDTVPVSAPVTPLVTDTGLLLGRAFQQRLVLQHPEAATSHPGATIATPAVPKRAGVEGETAPPQVLPEDAFALLRNAFERVSEQIGSADFVETTIREFQSFIEPQKDFFDRSLDLILDPGGLFVRNFSIYTRDSSIASNQTSLQVPISG